LKKESHFNWSSGKDSALALYKTNPVKKLVVCSPALINNFSVFPYGVRVELLEKQNESIGLPLEIMQIRNADDGSV
jgi:diphthamide synthase (EF-2-diphthine--ammonia ligase)